MNSLENEIWKVVKNFPDYQVSSLGRIKSLKFIKENIISQNKRNKYFQVNLWKNGNDKTIQVHTIVYETFYDDKLKFNECVHHKDENKENNYYKNLEKKPKSKHMSDHTKGKLFSEDHKRKISESEKGKIISDETKIKMRKNHADFTGKNNPNFGIHKLGEKSSNHKLTEQQVIQIKLLLKEGILTQQEIAYMFGVSKSTISYIKLGKSWSHVKLENYE